MNSGKDKIDKLTYEDLQKIIQEELQKKKKLRKEANVAAATPGFQSSKWVKKTKI